MVAAGRTQHARSASERNRLDRVVHRLHAGLQLARCTYLQRPRLSRAYAWTDAARRSLFRRVAVAAYMGIGPLFRRRAGRCACCGEDRRLPEAKVPAHDEATV